MNPQLTMVTRMTLATNNYSEAEINHQLYLLAFENSKPSTLPKSWGECVVDMVNTTLEYNERSKLSYWINREQTLPTGDYSDLFTMLDNQAQPGCFDNPMSYQMAQSGIM